jgi:hypothetical protein
MRFRFLAGNVHRSSRREGDRAVAQWIDNIEGTKPEATTFDIRGEAS